MKRALLPIIFLLTINLTYAQNSLTGKVLEYKMNFPLNGIKVENLTTHVNALTDAGGKFAINAKKGDLVCFSSLNYKPDTLYVANLKPVVIYLELLQNQLGEVKVVNVEINPNYYKPYAETGPMNSHTVLYQQNGGLKVMVPDWNKDANKKKTDNERIANGEKEKAIAQAFNAQKLQQYLPLKGQEMDNFIFLYKPDIQTYYADSFNLSEYVNDCYKRFLEMPAEKRQSKTLTQLEKNQASQN